MEITETTLLHLNYTLYFDEEGYYWQTRQEALEHCTDKDNIKVVRKQNCFLVDYNHLTDDQQDSMMEFLDGVAEDVSAPDLMYLISANTKKVIACYPWQLAEEELNNGLISVVDKKRNYGDYRRN